MPDIAYQQLAELWEAVFGEPPSVVAEPGLTAEIMVRCLPLVEPYSCKSSQEAGDRGRSTSIGWRPPRLSTDHLPENSTDYFE